MTAEEGKRLDLLEQQLAIAAGAGAWSSERHPELAGEEDIDRWLAALRGGWAQRAHDAEG